MSRFMRLFSGRWNIPREDRRSTSQVRQGTTLVYLVQFLDGTQFKFEVPKKAYGSVLYQKVFNYMDLVETDYFGLQFIDEQGINRWLEVNKPIKKQILKSDGTAAGGSTQMFQLKVKFYSSQPSNLKEEITRYQVFLQVKQDVLSGKLPCPFDTAVEMSALALQSELGDFDPSEHTQEVISEFRFVPNQTPDLVSAILEKFKSCKGMSPGLAEMTYLNKARWLELYGVDFHVVQGRDGNDYTLGLVPSGILVFEKLQKIGLFYWPKITRLQFKKKKIILEVVESDDKGLDQEHTFIFRCSSERACKNLWKCAVEHHGFFRLSGPSRPVGIKHSFLRMGSRFRYSGNTELQSLTSVRARKSVSFERKQSQRVTKESENSRKSTQAMIRHVSAQKRIKSDETSMDPTTNNTIDTHSKNAFIKRSTSATNKETLSTHSGSRSINCSNDIQVPQHHSWQQQPGDQTIALKRGTLKNSSTSSHGELSYKQQRTRTKSAETQRVRSQTHTPVSTTTLDLSAAAPSLTKKSSNLKIASSKSPNSSQTSNANNKRITETPEREPSNFNRRGNPKFQSTNMAFSHAAYNTDGTLKKPRKTFSTSNMMDVPQSDLLQKARIDAPKSSTPQSQNLNAPPNQNNYKENYRGKDATLLQNSFHSSLQKRAKVTSPANFQNRISSRNTASSLSTRYSENSSTGFQGVNSRRLPLTSSSGHNQHLNNSSCLRGPIPLTLNREESRSPPHHNHFHYGQHLAIKQANEHFIAYDNHDQQPQPRSAPYGFNIISSSGQLVAKELAPTKRIVHRDERSKSVVILTTEV